MSKSKLLGGFILSLFGLGLLGAIVYLVIIAPPMLLVSFALVFGVAGLFILGCYLWDK